ncbi:MAG: hypothetical protein MSC31_19055 [Solirubrobacteraceae bacterium MAG38_C4-C5]|nr:hypothetical protein [Candidatus Siliceabacter maunaloa]
MATTTDPPTPSSAPAAGGARPRLAEGIDLIGEYEGSGFKEAPHIARRADGQVLQLSLVLFEIAQAADGQRDEHAIAERVGERIGRRVSADNVRFLVERKLRPLGVLANADGSEPRVARARHQILQLTFRTAVIPERVTHALTTVFKPLFWPPLIVMFVAIFLAAMGWLFFVHGVGQPLRGLIYQPATMLAIFAGVVVGTAFHEIGHATAARYGGARPGVMGVGLYIVWPAFFTDVTDAYRLGKAGRLRVDLGGVYFNTIVAGAAVGAYFLIGAEWILLLAVAQTFSMLQQFLPFLRLDGYYILSDLTGVPDILTRIKPVLRSLIPGRKADDRVTELKPWARGVVTAYVCTLVPVLLGAFAIMLVQAPRAFATAYDSLAIKWAGLTAADGVLEATTGGLQIVMLVLPLAAITLTTTRVGKRAAGGAWRASDERPALRGGLVVGTAAAAALALVTWWPNGEYRPIQAMERGTLQSSLASLAEVPTGRPALTEERSTELGGAPFAYTDYDPAQGSYDPFADEGEGEGEGEGGSGTEGREPGGDGGASEGDDRGGGRDERDEDDEEGRSGEEGRGRDDERGEVGLAPGDDREARDEDRREGEDDAAPTAPEEECGTAGGADGSGCSPTEQAPGTSTTPRGAPTPTTPSTPPPTTPTTPEVP